MKALAGAILLTLMGMTNTVHGANNSEAIRYCEHLSFESDRTQCLQSIVGGYYDDGAVVLCRSFGYVSDQHNCLGTIRDRYYDSAEIALCTNTGFDSDRMNCLGGHGRPISPVVVQQPVYVQSPPVVIRYVRPEPIVSFRFGPPIVPWWGFHHEHEHHHDRHDRHDHWRR